MGNNEIYKTILKWIWIKITNKMWKAGFGRNWMINIIDKL